VGVTGTPLTHRERVSVPKTSGKTSVCKPRFCVSKTQGRKGTKKPADLHNKTEKRRKERENNRARNHEPLLGQASRAFILLKKQRGIRPSSSIENHHKKDQ